LNNTATALALMKMALALLDRAGAVTTACHLQAAIDNAEGMEPMAKGDTVSVEEEARLISRIPRKAAIPDPHGGCE
jgi:hypothetical protein